MLHITIFAIGKLKEAFWKDAASEYLKRLSAYAKVTIRELPDSTPEKEEAALVQALPSETPAIPVLLLDIAGTPTSSEALASTLNAYALQGNAQIVFVIGGSDGVTPAIKQRANKRISFGPITLPHNLARIVLLEQLYRAFKIIRHEPYHK